MFVYDKLFLKQLIIFVFYLRYEFRLHGHQ